MTEEQYIKEGEKLLKIGKDNGIEFSFLPLYNKEGEDNNFIIQRIKDGKTEWSGLTAGWLSETLPSGAPKVPVHEVFKKTDMDKAWMRIAWELKRFKK